MRRLQSLLLLAGLVAAPSGAVANPSDSSRSLGAKVVELTPALRTYFGATAASGVLVGEVDPTSPAAKAGLRVGDVITQVRGKTVDDPGDVTNAVAGLEKGQRVPLSIVRDHKVMTLDATLDSTATASAVDPEHWFQDFFRAFAAGKVHSPV